MATSPLFGWEEPDDVDLVKDGAAAIRTLGNAIDTSMGDLLGGTTGQVLSKASNTNMDFTWVTSDDANAIQNAIVDAKGDLIAASAADTPARLAVGNNGETLVADSSTSTGLRYQGTMAGGKNAIINGGFDIWQRGTSNTFNGAAFTYTADRWVNVCTGVAPTCTASRQTADTPGLQYGLRFGRNSGQTNLGSPYATTVLESAQSIPYAGKTVTLSFYAKAGANAPTSLAVAISSGTGIDQSVATVFGSGFTGNVSLHNANTTVTTTMARYSITVSVPSNASQLGISFYYGPSGTAGANEWFQIEGVQFEVGSVATNFTRAGGTIQGELAACQRYYYRQTGDNLYANFGLGTTSSTTVARISVVPPVTMRVKPSSVDYSTLALYDGGSRFTISALSINTDFSGATQPVVDATSSGMTAVRPTFIQGNGSASAYLGFSAEL